MRHHSLFLLTVCASLAAACAGEKDFLPEEGIPGDALIRQVTFEVPPILSGDGDPATKVSLNLSGADLGFRWEAADTVGIFPNAGSQVFFRMAEGAGTNEAVFNGGGWGLRAESSYTSYYPFNGDAYLEADAIPVSFLGQHQRGTSAFPGVRVYLASGGTTSSNGALTFTYTMVNSLVRVLATLPAGTYAKASLTLEEPLFAKDGVFDLTSPSITAGHHTRSLEVSLEDFVLTEAATVPIFFACAPVDLSGKQVTVEVETTGGKRYRCVKTVSRNYEAGKWYGLDCQMACIDQAPALGNRTDLWPSVASIPNRGAGQFAATAEEAAAQGFDPAAHQMPYLQWYEQPSAPNGTYALLIDGEDYNDGPSLERYERWGRALTDRGIQCAYLVYRTPRPVEHYCLSAWQDAQRAVRLIRAQAAAVNPNFANQVGVVSMGAGSHTALILATSSLASAYTAVDAYDNYACNLNWAIVQAPVYATSDDDGGELPGRDGLGTDVTLTPLFNFDGATCPVCLYHGQDDPHTPMASTLVYRKLRMVVNPSTQVRTVPAEVHLYPGKGHTDFDLDRGLEFLTQLGFMEPLQAEVDIMTRYASDADCGSYLAEYVWPAGQAPAFTPYFTPSLDNAVIEWFFPAVRKSKAIQIVFSGGAYNGSANNTNEVLPVRRYLNSKGVTVVMLTYRFPRPVGLAKHTPAWQDLQRAVRLIRSKAEQYGLDPDRIGVMGSSAGGHLAVMGTTSSRHRSYNAIDAIDDLSCKVQWGIGIYPAYLLTDDWEFYGYQYTSPGNPPTYQGIPLLGNYQGGNLDDAVLAPEFSFDLDTAPMLLLHGDFDAYASMNSVKLWEKLRSMGVPCEVHTLATRNHGFNGYASPGTGSYNYLERIWEFLEPRVTD